MRVLAALLAFMLLGAAPVDHARTIVATPEGGFRMGNPAAKVKLVEYMSMTCSHCADFHAAAKTSLRRDYISTGLVSFELRNFVLNGPDLAASALARCQGQAGYFRMADVFLTQQREWVAPFEAIGDAERARVQALPENARLAAMARAGKLDRFVAQLGIGRAAFDKCLNDSATVDRTIAVGREAATQREVRGTPTFFINGAKAQPGGWAAIEPQLRAAAGLKPRT